MAGVTGSNPVGCANFPPYGLKAITRVEAQVIRPNSELLKELQGLPVTRAVIYRNVDKKAWEQTAKEHQRAEVIIVPL